MGRRIRVAEQRCVLVPQVTGKDYGIWLVSLRADVIREFEADKTGAQDMPGLTEGEGDPSLQLELLLVFKAPGEGGGAGEAHGIVQHRLQQGLGGMRAEDLAAKPALDQFRQPADVVDMGVGEKKVIKIRRLDGPISERECRIAALGQTAVDQDAESVCPEEVAGTGDAMLAANMSDLRFGHVFW